VCGITGRGLLRAIPTIMAASIGEVHGQGDQRIMREIDGLDCIAALKNTASWGSATLEMRQERREFIRTNSLPRPQVRFMGESGSLRSF
jgi:hypothetical protein